jgi:choline-sulfatase
MAGRGGRPNLLVIMSDQHSRHVLGCYGDAIVRTPNLDRLAAEGMRFDACYCPAPLCVPSRMSFMTSRMPGRNRVWDNDHVLDSGIPTWVHHLGIAGYETALVGRMHFVGPDQRHGFAHRPIGELSAGHPGAPNPGFDVDRIPVLRGCSQDRRSVEIAGRGRFLYQWYDEQVVPAACEYLRQRARRRGAGPFAAVVGFLLPHNPYVAPAALFDYYYERVEVPDVEEGQPLATRRARRARGLYDPYLSREQVRPARAAYFGLCELLDGYVGRILECLEATGLARDTLVVYCSDHGDMAGEHGLWAKSCFYEGSVGVPAIARLPGVIEAGSACRAVCNLLDLGPTFAEAAGIEPMGRVDGRSLWAHMTGNPPADWPDETFSELLDLARWPREPIRQRRLLPGRMIRSGRWKLWTFADEDNLPPVLFDLAADPRELQDLATDPAHTATRDTLLGRVREGWDPQWVRDAGRRASESTALLRRWGAAVRPLHPDRLPMPSAWRDGPIELFHHSD